MKPAPRSGAPADLAAVPRYRAPLTGIVTGLALVAGLGLWTFQRIGEAKTLVADVEARRSADSDRAAALAREPQRVQVVKGTPEKWLANVDLDGTLDAQHASALGFKVGGRLSRVAVEVGDRVRAGSLLGQLDSEEAVARASAAEAEVRAAEASLAIAQDNERRTLPLVQNGSFTEASGARVSSERALASAQLDSARAGLALARSGVDSHTLNAPFSGTITRAPTGVGAVVAPGQVLFELVDTSTLKLSTTVTEADADLLATGAEVVVASERGDVRGRISAILSTLDARTRRVPVVAEFDNPSGEPTSKGARARQGEPPLRAGSFVRARVAAQREVAVLRVPHAVLRPGSQDEVLVVGAASSRLDLRRIVYSIAPDGTLLVRRGIDASDELVLAPIAEAKAGDEVRVERAGNAGSEGAPAAAVLAESKPARAPKAAQP
jgi:RND family efflux transporter MFP subunit